MAFSKSKPLLISIIFSLLLLNKVSSQSYSSPTRFRSGSPLPSPSPSPKPSPPRSPETVSFSFPFFQAQDYSAISFRGEASIAGGVLQLTQKDSLGNPSQNSVGRAQYRIPIHLWDKATGNLADFSTVFTFLINPKDHPLHSDGFAFFLAPFYSTIPVNSTGGYLGLFNPQTAINNTYWNQIVAVEFDTYVNEWDPVIFNHVGIDVNSIRSAVISPWPELDKGIATASIHYNGESKRLSVYVSSRSYPNLNFLVSHVVDLRTVLPEWVSVGFSAATGQLVETHDILSWSFEAAL